MAKITLTRLTADEREQFILDNQYAFKYGAMEEFGERDNHFEEDGEIISRKTIENSIDHGVAYCIREDGRTDIIPIRMTRRQAKRTTMKVKIPMACSALRNK